MANITDETLRLFEQALTTRTQMPTDTRGISASTGFTGYVLEAPAKVIVPVQTPMVNMLPRRPSQGIDIEHWKAITSFDTGRSWGTLSGNAVPTAATYSVTAMQNSLQPISLSNSVDFTAQIFARSFEGDLRAMAMAQLLYQLKITEERWIIGASSNVMVPPAPIVTQTAATGGHALDATTYYVAVTAINAQGETTMSARTTYTTPANAGANTGNLVITAFTVPNATGYNVYVGTTNARTSLWIQAAVSGNTNAAQPGYQTSVSLNGGGSTVSGEVQGPTITLTLTAVIATSAVANPPASNTAVSFVDGNSNSIMWDGLLAQALNNTGGSLALGSQASQPANANGVLALNDIDNMLVSMYNQCAGDPDILLMNSIVHRKLTNLVAAANQTRYVVESTNGAQGSLTAQYRVTHYLNEATGKMIPIVVDRYCPADSIIAVPLSIPYPVPQISNAVEMSVAQEYWGVDFAVTNSSFSFADYVYETLKVYFLGGLGVIRGITPAV